PAQRHLPSPSPTSQLTHSSLSFFFYPYGAPRPLPSFPTRRSSDLLAQALASLARQTVTRRVALDGLDRGEVGSFRATRRVTVWRSEEHTSELQSRENLVCRLLLEKKKKKKQLN